MSAALAHSLSIIPVGIMHSTAVFAICNPYQDTLDPARKPLFYGSHFQGSLQQNLPRVIQAGVTIPYYTSYVEQADNSDAGAWQMILVMNNGSGTNDLAQAGFWQEAGDTQDYAFIEYGKNNVLGPPMEYYSFPRHTAAFNVGESTSNVITFFEGSTLFTSVSVDWVSNAIQISGETHDHDDQGYGGYQNHQVLSNAAMNLGGGGILDNLSGYLVPTSFWLGMQLDGTSQIETWDTMCAT